MVNKLNDLNDQFNQLSALLIEKHYPKQAVSTSIDQRIQENVENILRIYQELKGPSRSTDNLNQELTLLVQNFKLKETETQAKVNELIAKYIQNPMEKIGAGPRSLIGSYLTSEEKLKNREFLTAHDVASANLLWSSSIKEFSISEDEIKQYGSLPAAAEVITKSLRPIAKANQELEEALKNDKSFITVNVDQLTNLVYPLIATPSEANKNAHRLIYILENCSVPTLMALNRALCLKEDINTTDDLSITRGGLFFLLKRSPQIAINVAIRVLAYKEWKRDPEIAVRNIQGFQFPMRFFRLQKKIDDTAKGVYLLMYQKIKKVFESFLPIMMHGAMPKAEPLEYFFFSSARVSLFWALRDLTAFLAVNDQSAITELNKYLKETISSDKQANYYFYSKLAEDLVEVIGPNPWFNTTLAIRNVLPLSLEIKKILLESLKKIIDMIPKLEEITAWEQHQIIGESGLHCTKEELIKEYNSLKAEIDPQV